MRTRRAFVLATVVALGASTAAQATKVKLNSGDQVAAATALLGISDLPKPYTWKEAATASGNAAFSSSSFTCKGFNPKTSDLVITGAAASSFTAQQVQIIDHASVMQTPQMVADLFRRTYVPKFVPCLTASLTAGAKGLKIVKAGAVTFAKEATYNAAFRVIFTIRGQSATQTGILDFIALGGGRKQVTFTVTTLLGPKVTAKQLEADGYSVAEIDLSLASKLAKRSLKG